MKKNILIIALVASVLSIFSSCVVREGGYGYYHPYRYHYYGGYYHRY